MISQVSKVMGFPRHHLMIGVHSLCAGGTERVVSVLLDEFSQTPNLELHLLLYGRKPEMFFDIPESVSIHRPPFSFNPKMRVLSTARTSWFIRQTIARVRPDVVLNFGEYWNNLMLLSTLGTSVPVLVADRSSPAKSLGSVHDALRRILYRKSSGVLVQTHEASKMMKKTLGPSAPIHVIPNPLFSLLDSYTNCNAQAPKRGDLGRPGLRRPPLAG